nr:MAG TPA: hypothetical protein [Caudoviricetes sp.]
MEQNIICMDMPLLMRILEEAREGVQSDAELHFLANQILQEQCAKQAPLTMDDYANITQYKVRFEYFADDIVESEED